MNERKFLLFKKACYDVGTRFSFVVNNKIIETVISRGLDIMSKYRYIGIRKKMVHSIKQKVLYLSLILSAHFVGRSFQKVNNSIQ